MTIDDYPHKQTLSLRKAINRALARKLRTIRFAREGGGTFRFERVHERWADYSDNATPPVAAIRPWSIADDPESRMQPSLCPDSWHPKGQDGFGLFVVGEATGEVTVVVRTAYEPDRDAIDDALTEGAFQVSDLGVAEEPIYGINLPMPEYYDRRVGVSFDSAVLEDSEDAVARNHWRAAYTFSVWATRVILARVPVMKPRIREVVITEGGIPDPSGRFAVARP